MANQSRSVHVESSLRRLTIGISLPTYNGEVSWGSDVCQSVAFLAMLLSRSEQTGPIYFLGCGDVHTPSTRFPLDGFDIPLVRPVDVTHELDVVIEMGAQLPLDWIKRMKMLGKKCIASFIDGTYLPLGETSIFDKDPVYFFNKAPFDEIWMLEKSSNIDAPMLRTLTCAPGYTIPYLWSPHFLNRRIAALTSEGATFGYHPGRRPWRVATLESNGSVAQSCHYPMLVCDSQYRTQPHTIKHLFVVNAMHMKVHPTFLCFANSLDLVRQHKASFEPYLDVADCMTRYADAVVSHQWEDSQRHWHYEVLSAGYPLIHNSLSLGDAGYYYPDFDVDAGSHALRSAWMYHDEQLDDYRARSNRLLEWVSVEHAGNLAAIVTRVIA